MREMVDGLAVVESGDTTTESWFSVTFLISMSSSASSGKKARTRGIRLPYYIYIKGDGWVWDSKGGREVERPAF
jgi:hypothetical protein